MQRLVRTILLTVFAVTAMTFAADLNAQLYGLSQANPQSSGFYNGGSSTYNMGWRFTCNVDGMRVTHIGCHRPYGGSNQGQLWDLSSNQQVATVTFNATANQWNWGQLQNPVTLVNGRQYIVSSYGRGYWYNNSPPSQFRPSGGDVTYSTSIYTGGNSRPTSTLPGQYGIADFCYTKGPNLEVTAMAGTRQQVYADETGPQGNGLVVGTFDIENNATAGAQLDSIDIAADPASTADPSADLVDIALYRDSAQGTTGQWDPMDVQIDTAKTFASAAAAASFNVTGAESMWAANQARTYFIVIRLNGMATPAEMLDFIVEDIGVTMPTGKTLPGTAVTMEGVLIQTPDMVFVDGSAPNQTTAYLGTGDNVMQTFTVSYPNGPNNALTTITIEAEGTGDDALDYANVELYRDANNNSVYDAGTDVLAAPAAVFSADDGNAQFALNQSEQNYQAGDVRTYFIVAEFNLMAADQDTFRTRVSGATAGLPGTNVAGIPAPNPGTGYLLGDFAAGAVIQGNGLIFFFNGPDTVSVVDNDANGQNGDGELLLDFTLFAINEPWTVTSFTFRASGTGNDATAYASLALYEDANSNGQWDGPGVDTLATTMLGTAFSADNGTYTATLANQNMAQNTNRRFFLRGEFASTAVVGETFNVALEASNATTPGVGQVVNLPTQASTALEIDEGRLIVTMEGPTTARAINSNSIGSQGYGEVIADFTLDCKNDAYTVSSVDLTANGTGQDAMDLQSLTLYEDSNGNGIFDGAGTDGRATATGATAFPLDNGTYRALLSNQQLTLNQTRRFFLLASFAGTAQSGETFNASVTAVAAQAQNSGSISGVPTASSSAIVIAPSAITIRNAPFAPTGDTTLQAGTAQTHVLAAFRFEASNATATLNGFTLTLAGTANWSLDAAFDNGLQVWMDDGNGSYDAGSDTLMHSSMAAAPGLDVLFDSTLDIQNSTYVDFFVVVNLTASAGGSLPDSFTVSIASTADVMAGTGTAVVRGTPAPVSETLYVLDFRVASFTPQGDFVEGGAPITILGSGLIKTTSLRIGGVPCGGIPDISPDGTRITGYTVPRGKGSNLAIELTTDYLGTVTLSQRFSYLGARPLDGGGGSSVDQGACSQGNGTSGAIWLLLLAGLGAGAMALRRRTV